MKVLPFGTDAECAEIPEHTEPMGRVPSSPVEGSGSRQGLQHGLIGTRLAFPVQRGNCAVPSAEPVPNNHAPWPCRYRCGMPSGHRAAGGCRFQGRQLLAASLFGRLQHRRDGIKMLALIWQRQPWDISRQ